MMPRAYHAYWGKARTENTHGAPCHLLPYHCLDVAAVGQQLMRLPAFGLGDLADRAGLAEESLRQIQTFFLALHDLGKFARGFQSLVPNLAPALVAAMSRFDYGDDLRHDTLGWLAWKCEAVAALANSALTRPEHDAWSRWFLAVAGHHGEPPRQNRKGAPITSFKDACFHPDDLSAVGDFCRDIADLLLPKNLPAPAPSLTRQVKAESWRLAGLTVLADWLGSNQDLFGFCAEPMPLETYWHEHALPGAVRALALAGLGAAPVRPFHGGADLFDYLKQPTPLQQFASDTPLGDGPQLFILEDVTGAGKTEAALILAHRLMAHGQGRGIYFGLPTMATSNQMYRRVGAVFRKFFADDARPSLVLAHGARHLVEDFSASILPPPAPDRDYGSAEPSAGAACAAWLGDTNKKALLAEVGVGTIDQALLAVMPARHQSLRLLGLGGKVLILDEVHAFDGYTGRLLQILLEAHARQGGSAILLSATLPGEMRDQFVEAFRHGRGNGDAATVCGDPVAVPYPLVTHAGAATSTTALDTRAQVKRRLPVRFLHDRDTVVQVIRSAVEAGQCVAWIRNTVDDAREAWAELRQAPWLDPAKLMLFHSRFALADRLEIENRALDAFGKTSRAEQRQGRVLIATQVLEQSVDLDADVMISDLAPIDLLIQRAGRLHRHCRDSRGNPASTDSRPEPVLHVFAPVFEPEPARDWYSSLFRRAANVYPDVGRLWLTQRVLSQIGVIAMPEDARLLIESVYGGEADSRIPFALAAATDEQAGKRISEESLACTNALQLDKGYCRDSGSWDAEEKTPTRLGEDDREFILLRAGPDGLQPWAADHSHPWAASAVKIAARKLDRLDPAWEKRFGEEVLRLRESHRGLRYATLLPLVYDGGAWIADGLDAKGRRSRIHYDPDQGVVTGSADAGGSWPGFPG
jgi:CRISPR-associated endonuclease/helicase Cas3